MVYVISYLVSSGKKGCSQELCLFTNWSQQMEVALATPELSLSVQCRSDFTPTHFSMG